MSIHPSATIHPKAELGQDVDIGPYAVIGEHVCLGAGTRIGPHAVIDGWTTIGQHCDIGVGAVLGGAPQDLKYRGQRSFLHISDHSCIREYVTIHRSAEEDGVTSIGTHTFLMAYTHVAHDCRLGNFLIMANAASLAGHITIGDHAIIGGLSGIHQWVRIGAYAMVGGCCALGQDLPPFMRAAGGYRARMYGLNSVGLRRHGFSADRVAVLAVPRDLGSGAHRRHAEHHHHA